jgi:hypothetical protein
VRSVASLTAAYASGNAISQVSPCAHQSKRTSPLSWPAIMFSIMFCRTHGAWAA